ncbi:hypothetical protein Q9L58_007970 [Maublancomyces gigas]|uniref:Uncharacterized protein n=1 Tax=Discina gigas TaxID=1032678 RepID=A0ABR3GC39_9PEZI
MTIDGVLVYTKDLGYKGTEKYEYRAVIPSTLTCCPYLWQIPTSLNLYLFITYTDYPPPVHIPRAGYEFFFFTTYNPMVASSILLFRRDLKPLHPKHVQALWKFLKHLKKKFTSVDHTGKTTGDPQGNNLPRALTWDDQSDRIWTLAEFWKEYCTMNNFSAFFDRLRYQKLMEGDESWRAVKSPYDF